jgi:sterol desaturase/sphingolipid hydroxylase (fatty acid hydroxylase superfamily)
MFTLEGYYSQMVPFFVTVILIEIGISFYFRLKLYTGRETALNVQMALMNLSLDIIGKGAWFLVLGFFYERRLVPTIENPWLYWPLALLFQDFCYYLHHYADHRVRFFWAIHVTHHSSEEFNLTTGFRSPVFQPLLRYWFFVPMAVLGFRPLDILVAYALTQHWGTLVHTQAILRLPAWIECIFVTPSHHRVHHASNPRYLDANMGMFLIIWDRMFGTFVAERESEPVKYGLTKPLAKRDLVHVVTHEWQDMWRDVRSAPTWRARWMYLFGPPGWSHDGSRKTTAELRKLVDQHASQPAMA